VTTRFQAHPLKQRPRAALQLGALGRPGVGGADGEHEAVAQALELGQPQQARTAPDAPRGGRRGDVGEAGRDHFGELALEPRDLRPQRLARRALTRAALPLP